MTRLSPEDIRKARALDRRLHARDLAAQLGLAEAEICAAQIGFGATRIAASPDRLIPRLSAFGPLMDEPVSSRIATDVKRWAAGGKGCH